MTAHQRFIRQLINETTGMINFDIRSNLDKFNRTPITDKHSAEPQFVQANHGFKGRTLSFLVKLPLVRNINALKRHDEAVRTENHRALWKFIDAMSSRYGPESVGAVKDWAHAHPTAPLTHRTMQTLSSIASNFHGKGDAKPMARHVVFRDWTHENEKYSGHTSLSVKNLLNQDSSKHINEYISWMPGMARNQERTAPHSFLPRKSREFLADRKTLFERFAPKTIENYHADKRNNLSDHTEACLERGFTAQNRRNGENVNSQPTADVDMEERYYPHADQKRYQSDYEHAHWGRSARKIYIPLIGQNRRSREPGRSHEFVMFGLNEINMIDEINEIKNLADMNKFDYVMASKTQNCAAIALRVLRSGGAEQFIPFNTSIISEYPNRAHAYAEAVQSKVDTLNRYVTEIDQHCEALLLNHETNAKWESFAKSSQSIDIDNNIKLIKQKMQIAPHLITRSELRITTMKHLDIKIARLSAKFDELSATASSKCRPLIIAKRECVPSASDTVNVLGRKAQALVEALHPHSVADGDRQTINPELMLTTQAIIKSIGELMAIQLT